MIDETRFRAFYQEMFPRLWRYVHRMVMDRSESEDLVQDTFFRFLRAARSDLADDQARSYLYRIATNLVRDKWRSRATDQLWLADDLNGDETPAPERDVGARIDIETAMLRLSPGQRSLVWLAYVEGYEHKEIAAIVGVKPASVRVLLMRARRRLAEFLNDPVQEETGT